MPYTMEDFHRDVARETLDRMTPEERLRGLSIEEIRAHLRRREMNEDE